MEVNSGENIYSKQTMCRTMSHLPNLSYILRWHEFYFCNFVLHVSSPYDCTFSRYFLKILYHFSHEYFSIHMWNCMCGNHSFFKCKIGVQSIYFSHEGPTWFPFPIWAFNILLSISKRYILRPPTCTFQFDISTGRCLLRFWHLVIFWQIW